MNGSWFQRFSLWLSRFMYGRHGGDQLGMALLALYCVLLVLSNLLRSPILYLLSLIVILFCFYRMLSRNWQRRWKENEWFLRWWGPAWGWFRGVFRRAGAVSNRLRLRVRDRKTSRYYRCPRCGNTLRVPKGRGKIVITCPVCGREFIKKA